jgi:hypothetical protein
MKKRITFIAFLSLYLNIEKECLALSFRTTYPGVTISSVSQTSDFGYIIAGYSTTYSIGSKDIVLIKTDSVGAVIWSKTYGNYVNSGADDVPANAVEIPGSVGYYVAGQFWNQSNNTYEIYILQTDANGNEIWSRTMYNGGYDKGMRIESAFGGGCLVTGWVGNSSKGYLCRLDILGNIVWQSSVSYPLGAWVLQSCKETADGGAIAAGYDNELGSYEMWLIRTNSIGTILWQRGYAMPATYNFCYDICLTNDNGFLLAGGSNGINLAKTDSSGNLQWAMTYSGVNAYPRAYSVMQCQDTGYIVLSNDLNNNQYLMKTDSIGNVIWTMKYSGGYYINTVEQTADGGYVLAMGSDVIKTNASGVTDCGEVAFTLSASTLTLNTRTTSASNTPQSTNIAAADSSTSPFISESPCIPTGINTAPENSLTVFPNPAGEELKIQNAESRIEGIEIYNKLGQKVLSMHHPSTSVDVSKLKPGVYFIRLISKEETVFRKFIVE